MLRFVPRFTALLAAASPSGAGALLDLQARPSPLLIALGISAPPSTLARC